MKSLGRLEVEPPRMVAKDQSCSRKFCHVEVKAALDFGAAAMHSSMRP
jgi:hypothetical protein